MNQLLINRHFKELNEKFPELNLIAEDNGSWTVKGPLIFSGKYEECEIEGEFSIEITIPDDYPEIPPTVRETANKIPCDFHTYYDGTLCLGAPLAVRKKFSENPTLIGFVEKCLIPYLFSFDHKRKYGEMPFGELSHRGQGILEYYQDLFDMKAVKEILGLIKILADDNYSDHNTCPCGSGKRLRSCHGPILLEIKNYQPSPNYLSEYNLLVEYVKQLCSRINIADR